MNSVRILWNMEPNSINRSPQNPTLWTFNEKKFVFVFFLAHFNAVLFTASISKDTPYTMEDSQIFL